MAYELTLYQKLSNSRLSRFPPRSSSRNYSFAFSHWGLCFILSFFLRKAWVPCWDAIFICGSPAVQMLSVEEIILPPFACLCAFVKALYYRFYMGIIILLIYTALKTLICVVPTKYCLCYVPHATEHADHIQRQAGESDRQCTDPFLVADSLYDVTNLSSLLLFP